MRQLQKAQRGGWKSTTSRSIVDIETENACVDMIPFNFINSLN